MKRVLKKRDKKVKSKKEKNFFIKKNIKIKNNTVKKCIISEKKKSQKE